MSNQAEHTKVNWQIVGWLRGLAALYVTINHCRGALFSDAGMYSQNVNPKANWSWWEHAHMAFMNHTGLGAEFVILFFILSGFSISHSLRKPDTNLGTFYKRRAVRLYPPYILGIAWSFVIFFLIWAFVPDIFYNGAPGFFSFKNAFDHMSHFPTLLSNLLYMPEHNHLTHQYWSLPFEVIFYLAAPWMIKNFKKAGLLVFTGYIIGWFIYGRAYHNPDHTNTMLQFTTDFGIYFIVGIVFYKYKDFLLRSFKVNKYLAVGIALVLFEIVVLMKGYLHHGEANKINGITIICFTYVLLFAALKYNFRIKWLEQVGNYSYTLYVTHWATIWGVKIIAVKMGYDFYYIHNMFFWYIGVAICLALAYLLYLAVERPSNRLVERLRKQPDKEQSTPNRTLPIPQTKMA